MPSPTDLVKAVLFELGLSKDGLTKFLAARDSCTRIDQKPVYEIGTSRGKLWPMVIVEQNGSLYCCLPLVPGGAHKRPPLIEIPGVTTGFMLLCALADFIRGISVPPSEVSSRTSDIYAFLTQAAPFGTVTDTTLESITVKMLNKPCTTPKTQKQPAWKPGQFKGKNQISLSVNEYIRAVQYDRPNIDDVWDVYGTIFCKAELEGTMPTITMTISQQGEGEITPLNHLVIHPCVQSADAHVIEDGGHHAIPRRVRFTPPLEKIPLCHYTACRDIKLPITGSFELFAEDCRAKVNVKLRLSENVRNSFEYCELQIPFVNSGPISIQDSSVSHGTLFASPDRTIAVWNIGQRFPVRSSEINMSAIIELGDGTATAPSRAGTLEEHFCKGQNSYAQLFFKINDFTLSGCYIDPKSIQVAPNMKFKLTSGRDFMCVEYKLWNVHGDCLVSALPRCLNQQPVDTEAG